MADTGEYCVGDERALISGEKAYAVVAGEFTKDAHPDLLIGRSPGGATLFIGRGAPGPETALTVHPDGDVRTISAPDLDMDGDPDIVLAIQQSDPDDPEAPTEDLLAIYFNESTAEGGAAFSGPQTYGIGTAPRDIAVADIGGDGVVDILTINETSSDISILDGNGDGTFTPRSETIPLDMPGQSLAIVDVNRDGQPDLLVATVAGETVDVLLQNAGTFETGLPIAVGRFPSDLMLAKVDANEQNDLVVVCEGSNEVHTFLYMADGPVQGLFAEPVITRLGPSPFSATAVDANRDGHLDVVTANREDASVTVLLGAGDGTFAPTDYPVAGFPADIAAADLDGDVSPDLALANVNEGGGISVVFTDP